MIALVAALYLVALQLVPEGACGRDSPFWFSAVQTATFIDFARVDPESGYSTPEAAALEYAESLLGKGDYRLVPGPGQDFSIENDGGLLLGTISISETGFGRYLVGGHTTCQARFEAFTKPSA
jgi:hypothetical protein